jgi:hypothetical protein
LVVEFLVRNVDLELFEEPFLQDLLEAELLLFYDF